MIECISTKPGCAVVAHSMSLLLPDMMIDLWSAWLLLLLLLIRSTSSNSTSVILICRCECQLKYMNHKAKQTEFGRLNEANSKKIKKNLLLEFGAIRHFFHVIARTGINQKNSMKYQMHFTTLLCIILFFLNNCTLIG